MCMCVHACACVCVCVSANITVVVCQSSKVAVVLKQAKTVPVLKTVISMGEEFSEEERAMAQEVGLSLYTFAEVMVRKKAWLVGLARSK